MRARPIVERLPQGLVGLLAVATMVIALVPLNPAMPGGGLDPSWSFAINEAVSRGMVLGRDLIFTYGPYQSIDSRMYHPGTDRLMLLGSAYLALYASAALLLLMRGNRLWWLAGWCVAVGALVAGSQPGSLSRDALLQSFPLLAAAVLYRSSLPQGHPQAIAIRLPRPLVLALLTSPLGFLPLIKLSFAPGCVALCLLFAALSLRRRERAAAAVAIGSPAATALVAWCLAGQPLLALPRFAFVSLGIISGYGDSMSAIGSSLEPIAFAIAALLILAAILFRSTASRELRVALLVAFALFFFATFKGAYIRHDDLHAPIASTAVLLALLILIACVPPSPALSAAIFASLFCWGLHDARYAKSSVSNLIDPIDQFENGIEQRMGKIPGPRERYRQTLAILRAELPLPVEPGTTDVYPYDQAYLIASGANWSPRPVLQSYSAYSPRLAELDRAHLAGAEAPSTIFFKFASMNNALPSLEDGTSWPEFLRRYSFNRFVRDFAMLSKRSEPLPEPIKQAPVTSRRKLGERVKLDAAGDLTYASITVRKTLLGFLIGFLYKPSWLLLRLELSTGRTALFRLIPGMASSTFLLSPLVESKEQLASLFGDAGLLRDNLVRALTVEDGEHSSLYWKSEYELVLTGSPLPSGRKLSADPVDFSDVLCEGHIDVVTPSAAIASTGPVSIEGWTILSGKDGTVPTADFIAVTDATNQTTYWPAKRVERPDVKAAFLHPEMPDPGFDATIDLSSLPKGDFTLAVARMNGTALERCSNLKARVDAAH